MAMDIGVQNNGGLLPDMILLTQGQRVSVLSLAISLINLKICLTNHDHLPFPRTLANKNDRSGEICGASREAQNIKRMRGVGVSY